MTAGSAPTVLVANRGEIASRVLRSARALGLRTVAVFSDADAGAPHTRSADLSVRIGPAAAAASYLSVDALLDAARTTGADLVHPGYGFLSERAAFARAVADAGLVFVGPSPQAIAAMGDKAAALRLVEAAGVPILEGFRGDGLGADGPDDAALRRAGEALGPPLMVKAAAGGGGRGMRLVTDLGELPDALAAARREAAGAFGDDTLLLERAVLGPRHVEVQVLADAHGTVLALGERDCSVQRRHQKVVEEAPSPAVDAELRARMQAAAVAVAQAVDYVGAGTVEFLLARDGSFAFLEMNTRIQVEHPITELAVRAGGEPVDLVAWQLRIAMGETLPWTQREVTFDGHAIEARLCAEDPADGYLPRTGEVLRWSMPDGPGLRIDAGIAAGSVVTPHYDPMLAKVVAHGHDRGEARRRLVDAIDRTVLLGVTSNRSFLAGVLRDPAFAAGDATTALLADGPGRALPGEVGLLDLALVAAWWHRRRTHGDTGPVELRGWTNATWTSARQVLRTRRRDGSDLTADVRVRTERDGSLLIDASTVCGRGAGDARRPGNDHAVAGGEDPEHERGVRAGVDPEGQLELRVGPGGHTTVAPQSASATRRLVRLDRLDGVEVARHRALVHLPRIDLDVTDLVLAPRVVEDDAGEGVLLAPMHGAVTAVQASVGDHVMAGDPVIVVEAMKMEHVVRADVDGVVTHLTALETQVTPTTVVARIEPADDG